MEDISPQLFKELNDSFRNYHKSNSKIMAFSRKLSKQNVTFKDCNIYVNETIKCYEKAIRDVFKEGVLPNDKMYWNIAQSVIKPTLENNYTLVTNAFFETQRVINKKDKINIKPLTAKIDNERIKGLLDHVCKEDVSFEDMINNLCSDSANYTYSVFVDNVKADASMKSNLGFGAKVVRIAESNCCDWCYERAGTYNYEDVKETGNDVWRRHVGCSCEIEYINGDRPSK